jgi:uncharacterized protein with GYD domain
MQTSEMPSEGVRLNSTYNVFGEWDFAVWFEANNNDEAVHFVEKKIRAIDGVVETLTMPATPIKEYRTKTLSSFFFKHTKTKNHQN